MIEVKVDDTGFRSLISQLSEAVKPESILKAIGLRTLKWINDNFEQEGKLSVGGWQALKESTLARRRGGQGKILQDTGRLRGSFEVLDYSASHIVVGSRLVYAATHNYGRGVVPARVMVPNKVQATELATTMMRAALKRIGR